MAVKGRFTGARVWATAWQVPIIVGFAVPGIAAAADEGRQAGALEEVVVTARKREESLQDTPIAISAFSAAALERQQITSTEDLDQVAPNLQFASYGPLTGNNSAAQVYIRGIGQSDGSSGVDPGVGLYIDDVYMGRSVGGVLDFRDVSNVQILRGPQGTLFGRNTIGGAVLLTTTLPGKEFGGTARVGFGDDKLYEGFAAVDLPDRRYAGREILSRCPATRWLCHACLRRRRLGKRRHVHRTVIFAMAAQRRHHTHSASRLHQGR